MAQPSDQRCGKISGVGRAMAAAATSISGATESARCTAVSNDHAVSSARIAPDNNRQPHIAAINLKIRHTSPGRDVRRPRQTRRNTTTGSAYRRNQVAEELNSGGTKRAAGVAGNEAIDAGLVNAIDAHRRHGQFNAIKVRLLVLVQRMRQ